MHVHHHVKYLCFYILEKTYLIRFLFQLLLLSHDLRINIHPLVCSFKSILLIDVLFLVLLVCLLCTLVPDD
jgi:hypothetical protein